MENKMYKLDFTKPVNVHFMGIGGISMSGLAEILHDRGFKVTGSDRSKSSITEALSEKGISIKYGQVKENITDDIDLLVYTAAISADNEELLEAKRRGIECKQSRYAWSDYEKLQGSYCSFGNSWQNDNNLNDCNHINGS